MNTQSDQFLSSTEKLLERFQDLRQFVGWSDADMARIDGTADDALAHIPELVDEFYRELQRHPHVAQVIQGGEAQVQRLRALLADWLQQMFRGPYDADYVVRRWQVGKRHVEIGLDQIYTAAAMSRLRNDLIARLCDGWRGDEHELMLTVQAFNRLFDLELAMIEDAYEAEHLQRLQQAERRRSESTFRDLVEAAGCMIVILHADGAIRYFSQFAAQLTGFSVAEAQGRDFGENFLPEAEREMVYENLHHAIEGEPMRGFQSTVLCRNGRSRVMMWNVRRLDQFDSEPVLLAVGHDITSLKDAQQTALQSERLAAIGQMSTGLAHESRSALQRIQACTEMLELEVEGNDDALELLHRIQKAQDHLHRLFDEVRGYAAPVTLDLSEAPLTGVWREAWELLTPQRARREVVLREEIGDTDVICRVDHFRLVQAFRNLLENSLAARSDPVEISIRCQDAVLDGRPALRITVADNGPGFNEEQRKRAFDPFFTTKPKGTGLGMAIAQRNVEAHDGTLEIAECSQGAEIVMILPRHPE